MKRKGFITKISTAILTALVLLVVMGVFASNLVLKNVYDHRDRDDLYWNYNKILKQPFKYLKIDGGNVTSIIFEPSKHASVRVLNYWQGNRDSVLKVFVKNDTLHLLFSNKYDNLGMKYWMQSHVLVRLFAPQLLAIDGSETNFELQKLRQKSISINLRGKSRLEVESYSHDFDTLKVTQRDSSQVVFEMSPDLKTSPIMHFNYVNASLSGYTLLDIGRSFTDNLKMIIADSSAIILSGKSIRGSMK